MEGNGREIPEIRPLENVSEDDIWAEMMARNGGDVILIQQGGLKTRSGLPLFLTVGVLGAVRSELISQNVAEKIRLAADEANKPRIVQPNLRMRQ